MTKTIDERVDDLESIYGDLPSLLNLRLDEVNGRLNLLDRQMAAMIRDMRDLRGGVTRQLIEQDKQIAALRSEVAALHDKVAALNERFAALNDKFDEKIGALDAKLDAILARLPAA
ncbi:MAG: hypothetical protein ABL901_18220 [Hyphomicrobiaceae bacterium]